MDKHSEMIWQRGSACEIMREARNRFRDNLDKSPVAARVALASVHYSLIKRYVDSWWQKPLAFWHTFHAIRHVRGAFEITRDTIKFSADQIDVVTTILVKTPSWLGGDRICAISLLNSALYLNTNESMKPHTRALMLATLGEIEYGMGSQKRAFERYAEARHLIPAIEEEDSSDRKQQLVRVLAKVGLFYYEHGSEPERYWAGKLVGRAINLADSIAKDQAEKIRAQWQKLHYR